jgi:iron complex outermembrane receptor protein
MMLRAAPRGPKFVLSMLRGNGVETVNRNRRYRNIGEQALALFGGLILHSAAALAQQSERTDVEWDRTTAQSGVVGLEEVTVTARRREESLQKVPESVTVFTDTQIEGARIRRLRDFVTMTPGFEIHDGESPGIFRMSIRGITQTNQGDAPVTMVVDGVTLPYANSFGKALFDIEQIEVLKGPQGSLYGQNAIGGAVLVRTRQPTNEFSGRLTASYGNHESSQLIGAISGPIVEDKVLFRLSGYMSDDEGDMRYAFFPDEYASRESRDALRGDLTVNFTDELTLALGASVGYTFYGGAPLVPKALSAGSGIPGVTTEQVNENIVLGRPSQTSPDLPRNRQHYWDVSAKLDLELEFGTFTAVTAYQSIDERETQDLDVSHIPFVYGNLNNLIDAISGEVRFSSRDTGSFHWVIGAAALNTDRDYDIDPVYVNLALLTTGDLDPADAVYVPFTQTLQEQDLDAYAIFGQAEWEPSDFWQITVGGRYDEDPRKSVTTGFTPAGPLTPLSQKRTFREFQPKGSVRYSITPNANVYFTVARGFRPGGFNSGTNAAVVQAFDAETTTSYEVGAKFELFDRRLLLSTAAFYTDYKNQQLSLVSVSSSGVSQDNFTVDRTRIQGLEIEVQARPLEGLDLNAGFAYTDGQIKEFGDSLTGSAFDPSSYVGNDVPLVSEYTFNASAQYARPIMQSLEGIVRLDVERKGRLYWEPDNKAERSPYTQVDASVGVRGDWWELRAYGENIFDKRYDTLYFDNLFVGAPGGFNFAYLSKGVRYGLEGTVRF